MKLRDARAAGDRRSLRRVVRAVGGTLVGAGALLLLFVAYQLWGTGLQEARAQDALRADFERAAAAVTRGTTTTEVERDARPPSTTTTTAVALAPPPPLGEALGTLQIPRLGLDKVLVEGSGPDELQKGPGHYPSTPLPGRSGNVAIAGHRTTYGAPFFRLNELVPGDEIIVTTLDGTFRYIVVGLQVVEPSQIEVIEPTGDDRLTLTTCEPRYSARYRLVVTAALQGPPIDAVPVEPATVGPVREPDDRITAIAPASRPTPPPPPPTASATAGAAPFDWWVVWPGLLTAASAALAWFAARRTRRWWVALAGVPVTSTALLVFFERVSATLPPGV